MRTSVAETLTEAYGIAADPGALFEEYLDFARDPANTYRGTASGEHFTASGFVFNLTREKVLLCFHKKGQFWVQFGGHIEPEDDSLLEAATREVKEESGLANLRPLLPYPAELNRHELSDAFGKCRAHWDVGFAFEATEGEDVLVSDESEDVRWWPIRALPANAAPLLGQRITAGLAAVDSLMTSDTGISSGSNVTGRVPRI